MLIVFNSGSAIVISPFVELLSLSADYNVNVGDFTDDLNIDSLVLDPTASLISIFRSIHFPISIPDPNISSDHDIQIDGAPPTSEILSIGPNEIDGYDVSWTANDDGTGCNEVALLYKKEGEGTYSEYAIVPLGGQKTIDSQMNIDFQVGQPEGGTPYIEAGTPYVLATRVVDELGNIETDIPETGDVTYTFTAIVEPADSDDDGGGGGGATCFLNLLESL